MSFIDNFKHVCIHTRDSEHWITVENGEHTLKQTDGKKTTQDSDFDESKHPRSDNGQFGNGNSAIIDPMKNDLNPANQHLILFNNRYKS
ncbi:MAG: hypothetical protein WCP96_22485, partial [Methylococcaceae bacterium]